MKDKTISFKYGIDYSFNEIIGIELLTKFIRIKNELQHLSSNDKDIMLFDEKNYAISSLAVLKEGIVRGFFGSFKFEMSENELIHSCNEILFFLNREYSKNHLDFEKIDPMYLEQVLGVDLPFLVSMRIVKKRLRDLRCFSLNNSDGIELSDGRYFKQLATNSFINIPRHKNNFVFQSNEERIKNNLKLMSNNNYASNGEYIILYNYSNVIRDGEHRASALFYLYGDIEIPVMILDFSKNYYSFKLYHEKGGKQ